MTTCAGADGTRKDEVKRRAFQATTTAILFQPVQFRQKLTFEMPKFKSAFNR
jgi:hypothetical protein